MTVEDMERELEGMELDYGLLRELAEGLAAEEVVPGARLGYLAAGTVWYAELYAVDAPGDFARAWADARMPDWGALDVHARHAALAYAAYAHLRADEDLAADGFRRRLDLSGCTPEGFRAAAGLTALATATDDEVMAEAVRRFVVPCAWDRECMREELDWQARLEGLPGPTEADVDECERLLRAALQGGREIAPVDEAAHGLLADCAEGALRARTTGAR